MKFCTEYNNRRNDAAQVLSNPAELINVSGIAGSGIGFDAAARRGDGALACGGWLTHI
jgi:hypothetical protein